MSRRKRTTNNRRRRPGQPPSYGEVLFYWSLASLLPACLMTAFSFALNHDARHQAAEYRSALNWPATAAIVVQSEVVRTNRNRLVRYRPAIAYRYQVGDRTFVGDRYSNPSPADAMSLDDATLIVEQHPTGASIEIRYDDASPNRSCIQIARGVDGHNSLWSIVIGVVVSIVLAACGPRVARRLSFLDAAASVPPDSKEGIERRTRAATEARVARTLANHQAIAVDGRRSTLLVPKVIAATVVLVCSVLLVNEWSLAREVAARKQWPKVRGEVVRVFDQQLASPSIEYAYEVAGRQYRSTRFSWPVPLTAYPLRELAELIKRHPTGIELQVLHDPSDPSQAFVVRRHESAARTLLSTIAITVIGYLVAAAVQTHRESGSLVRTERPRTLRRGDRSRRRMN